MFRRRLFISQLEEFPFSNVRILPVSAHLQYTFELDGC
jgi:hypothetical protein